MDWERDEARAALADLTELQRATACRHNYRPNRRRGGTCECGDELREDEL